MTEMLDRFQAKYQIQQGNLTDLEVCLHEDNRWEAIGVNRGKPIQFSIKTPNGHRCADYDNVQRAISFILKISKMDSPIRVSVRKKNVDGLMFSENDVAELNKINAIDSVFNRNITDGFEIFIRLNDANKTPALVLRKVYENRKDSQPYQKKAFTIRYMNRVGIDLSLLDGINTMERHVAIKSCREGALKDPFIVLNADGKWEPMAKLGDKTMRFYPPNQNRNRTPCEYRGAANALGYLIHIGFCKGEVGVRAEGNPEGKPVGITETDAISMFAVGCFKEPKVTKLGNGYYQLLCDSIDGSTTFNLLPYRSAKMGCYAISSWRLLVNLMTRIGFKNIPKQSEL